MIISRARHCSSWWLERILSIRKSRQSWSCLHTYACIGLPRGTSCSETFVRLAIPPASRSVTERLPALDFIRPVWLQLLLGLQGVEAASGICTECARNKIFILVGRRNPRPLGLNAFKRSDSWGLLGLSIAAKTAQCSTGAPHRKRHTQRVWMASTARNNGIKDAASTAHSTQYRLPLALWETNGENISSSLVLKELECSLRLLSQLHNVSCHHWLSLSASQAPPIYNSNTPEEKLRCWAQSLVLNPGALEEQLEHQPPPSPQISRLRRPRLNWKDRGIELHSLCRKKRKYIYTKTKT